MSVARSASAYDISAAAFSTNQVACSPVKSGPITSPPRVSVLVLNHNGERIIGKCLDHLLAQTFDDFEILVVDNNSSDASLAVMEPYLASGRLSIVRASKNLGVAGGRNLGMRHVQGSIVAFIDNDGYAHPKWLAAAVTAIDSDVRLGVVASVVFFAGRKIILNGAGGTVNLQGYGGDFCFETSYEFARLPRRVLYAMGCGMVVRRDALDRIGPLDEKLFNYYDDTELGIRAWKSGYEVAVAPDAWIDHGFGYSDKLLGNKPFLCERNRIRTVLKYFPKRRLPAWFAREIAFIVKSPRDRLPTIIRAWLWNLMHLPSALRLRIKFEPRRGAFYHLLAPAWGHYPLPVPNNQANYPDLGQAHNEVVFDGKSDAHQLNFGWYDVQYDGTTAFRWSASQASVLFRLRKPVITCTLGFAGSKDRKARILIRPLGSLNRCLDETFPMSGKVRTWRTFPVHLPAGDYELLILCEDVLVDEWARTLGVAVSLIRFD